MSKTLYVPALTWLRAVAAFLVVISHAIRTVEGPWTVKTDGFSDYMLQQSLWFVRLFDLGSFGVCLFFALSGFTLYLSNRRSLQHSADMPSFYLKRIARIWPAFMVSLLVYTLFALLLWPHYQPGADSVWMQGNFRLPDTVGDVLKYVFLTFDLTGPAGYFVGPYWSLPVEFHYYLLMAPVAIIMATLPGWRFTVPVAVGGVLVLIGRYELAPIADMTVFNMALSFFLGVALADLYERNRLPALGALTVWALLLTVFTVVTSLWQGFIGPQLTDIAYLLFPPLTIYAVLNIHSQESGPITRLLGKYGTYSYSIYLYHMLSFGLIALIASQFDVELNEGWFWPVFIAGLTSSYFIAWLSYKYVEVPSIALGRTLAKQLSRKPQTTVNIQADSATAYKKAG